MKIKIIQIPNVLACILFVLIINVLPTNNFAQSSIKKVFTTQEAFASPNNTSTGVNRKNILTISPVILFLGSIIDLKYERVVNEVFTISFNPTFYSINKNSKSILEDDGTYSNFSGNLKTFNFWVQGRFYLSRKYEAPQGFFIAPEFSLGFAAINGTKKPEINSGSSSATKDVSSTTFTFNTGLAMGYQWVLKERFIIDMYYGLTKYYMMNDETANLFKKAYYIEGNLLLPSWGLGIGYSF